MIIKQPEYYDPLVQNLYDYVESESAKETPRQYVGASSIGDDCERKLYYNFHRAAEAQPTGAKGTLAANDGHRSEEVAAAYLRQLPSIQLWTKKEDGSQYGFTDLNGKFRGHLDGIIKGIPLAPATPHVWEHKAKNQRLYDALTKLKEKFHIKEVLKKWDAVYYAQAVIYMHYYDLTRHYMTVSLPGFRDLQTIRTDANPTFAQSLIEKAKRVINATRPPMGISQNPTWFECKFCKFNHICFKE